MTTTTSAARQPPARHGVSVAAVVTSDDGHILLIERRDNGRWEVPGGVLEHGEALQDGLIREVREETGLTIAPGDLTGIYHNVGDGVLNLVFRAAPHGGTIAPTREATQVQWLPLDQARTRVTPDHAARILDALTSQPVVLRVTGPPTSPPHHTELDGSGSE